ncbi:hypothetical protein TorRG33x02_242620 [Trema orientale]|uniref:MULE transposase domain-containing protein n=1 Tax=Trema orientale TaxID=63057 RepID=A0A2P5DSS1_TREOI|nr:hypothetical protein TorRG33x02_242620 [Trema orientale]
MRRDHGVHMSYKKAWRAKEKALIALNGSDEDAYRFLPRLAFLLKWSNPCSIVALSTDEHDIFRYFFVSLTAFIQGWPHCRPVIVVDGTFLKANFRETLLTAMSNGCK